MIKNDENSSFSCFCYTHSESYINDFFESAYWGISRMVLLSIGLAILSFICSFCCCSAFGYTVSDLIEKARQDLKSGNLKQGYVICYGDDAVVYAVKQQNCTDYIAIPFDKQDSYLSEYGCSGLTDWAKNYVKQQAIKISNYIVAPLQGQQTGVSVNHNCKLDENEIPFAFKVLNVDLQVAQNTGYGGGYDYGGYDYGGYGGGYDYGGYDYGGYGYGGYGGTSDSIHYESGTRTITLYTLKVQYYKNFCANLPENYEVIEENDANQWYQHFESDTSTISDEGSLNQIQNQIQNQNQNQNQNESYVDTSESYAEYQQGSQSTSTSANLGNSSDDTSGTSTDTTTDTTTDDFWDFLSDAALGDSSFTVSDDSNVYDSSDSTISIDDASVFGNFAIQSALNAYSSGSSGSSGGGGGVGHSAHHQTNQDDSQNVQSNENQQDENQQIEDFKHNVENFISKKNLFSQIISFEYDSKVCKIDFELFGRSMHLSFCEFEDILRNFAKVVKLISLLAAVFIMFV